jgi:hypothetical protein
VKRPSYGALQTDIQSDMAFFFLRMRLLASPFGLAIIYGFRLRPIINTLYRDWWKVVFIQPIWSRALQRCLYTIDVATRKSWHTCEFYTDIKWMSAFWFLVRKFLNLEMILVVWSFLKTILISSDKRILDWYKLTTNLKQSGRNPFSLIFVLSGVKPSACLT